MLTWMLSSAWMLACRSEALRFDVATRCVAESQRQLLMEMLKRNSRTAFGRRYQLGEVRDVAEFQRRVPLSLYQDYCADIERISAGEQNILTHEPVNLLEPTSGSTAGEKLIPVTRGLRRDFQRAISPWLYDLLKNRPGLRLGRSYWSVSPAMTQNRVAAGGIRIGFDDDAEYLSWPQEQVLRRLLAVPPSVRGIQELHAFRSATLQHLLAADDLTLISVWSPTFLLALIQELREQGDGLLADASLMTRRRRRDVKAILCGPECWREKLKKLWPRLGLISCWADATASRYIPELRESLPHVEIQPKGLLATEGCVSFPLLGQPAAALAIRSHFYEFQSVDGQEIRLAHELDIGARYRVILTTRGGLYRYQLRDEIEVCGFFRECPLIRFVGKADGVCDMVGEKLAETHCRQVIDRVLAELGIHPAFVLIAPVYHGSRRYCLYIQDERLAGDAALVERIRQAVDSGLRENPYYEQALSLGQLLPLAIVLLDPQKASGVRLYEQACLARGMRLGNIKPTMLDAWDGWPAVFARDCLPCAVTDTIALNSTAAQNP